MTIEASRYKSFLLDIVRPSKVGTWEIEHERVPAGTELPMFNPQTGIYWDRTDQDFSIVTLREGGTDWMSTEPFEQDTVLPSAGEAKGDVLVAGLGLGMVSLAMAARSEVRTIQHVEIQKEVVDLVWDQITGAPEEYHPEKLRVRHGDVMEFLRTTEERFDYVHLDIWPDPIEPISGHTSAREFAKRALRPDGRVWTWLQENVPLVEGGLAAGAGYRGAFGTYAPCKGCGKLQRADYGGLCRHCANVLGISERFPERPEGMSALG